MDLTPRTPLAFQPAKRWEVCAVDPCPGCVDGDGADYRGGVATTSAATGSLTCQKWTAQTPHSHGNTPEAKPGKGLGDHNYCRNPDGRAGGPWCYTMDFPNKRYEACHVDPPQKSCAHQAISTSAGGETAPVPPKTKSGTISLGRFSDGSAKELESIYYEVISSCSRAVALARATDLLMVC